MPRRPFRPTPPRRWPWKLAYLVPHTVQYHAPLFQRLAMRPEVKLQVYYCAPFGLESAVDVQFGKPLRWDPSLGKGYRYKILRNVSPLPVRPSAFYFWRAINPGIVTELVRERFDAVIVHGYALATYWLAFLACWARGTPVILSGEPNPLHTARPALKPLRDIMLRSLCARVDAFLAIGSTSRDFYRKFGAADEKIFLTPYSIDNERFMKASARALPRRREIRRELGLPDRLPVILFCGKLYDVKRPFDLLEAFSRVRTPAALAFAGSGPLEEGLKQRATQKGLKNVVFLGFRKQEELPDVYTACDALALVSSSETFGVVLNEAMCCGLPVVATDSVGAAADLVRDGENGFVVPFGDIDALADRLERMAGDPEERNRMGRASLKRIRGWNYDRCVQGILESLEYVCRNANPADGRQ